MHAKSEQKPISTGNDANTWALKVVLIRWKNDEHILERMIENNCHLNTILSWKEEGEHFPQTRPCRTNRETSSSEEGPHAKQKPEEVFAPPQGKKQT